MTASSLSSLIYGAEPHVAGRRCSALVCEHFVAEGSLVCTANVTFINVEGEWYRLAIDHPTIHWRQESSAPHAWSVPQKGWEYPHVNVATAAQLTDAKLEGIDSNSDQLGTCVAFIFEGQRRVEIRGTIEGTSYAVI
jgi:hypothetical protein